MENKQTTTNLFYSFFILFMLSFGLFQTAKAQLNYAKNSSSQVSITTIKSTCKFFSGDTLTGFDLDAAIRTGLSKYTMYSELVTYIRQHEVSFMKKKYNISSSQNSRNGTPINKVLAGVCNNLDFESGNYTGWTGGTGYNPNTNGPLTIIGGAISTLGINSAETSCSFHTLVNSGTDPYSGLPMVDPGGGSFACRLGGELLNIGCDGYNASSVVYPYYGTPAPPNITTCNSTDPNTSNTASPNFGEGFSNGEVLQQTFPVTTSNCLFSYSYAVVLSDAPHTGKENPYFSVQVFDHTGTVIPCLSYFVEADTTGAGGVPPGFLVSPTADKLGNSVLYTPWTLNSLNLQPYIGTNVTVKFTAAGCTQGGHFCYAYVDGACSPLDLIIPSGTVCSGLTQTITGPPNGVGGTYSWSGPGIVSGGTTQTITANQPGTYSVTLTNQKGCSYTIDTSITFYPTPTLTVNSPSLCLGGTTTLTVNSTGTAGTLTYNWNPTTGLAFSPGDSVATSTPAANATYTITGTSVHSCTNMVVSQVTVNTVPPPTFTAPAVCNGTAMTFSTVTVPGGSYNWNFGDLTTLTDVSIIQNPNYLYPAAGNYAVTFTVTTAAGCRSNTTQTVTVNPMPPIHFTANHPCDGSAVIFTNTTTNQASFSHWHWDFDNGDTSNVASPSYTYTAPAGFSAAGCYSVTLTATTTAGCTGSHDTIVYVHNNPFAYFNAFEACFGDASEFIDSSFVQNPSCLNDQITSWNYDFGDGQTSTYNSSTLPDTIKHIYASCGGYNITATVTTNNGCTFSNTLPGDTVFCLPVVVAPTDFSVCPGAATPVQIFTTTCGNGGTPTAQWFQSLTNVDNTGAPASFINPGGFDQVPSYNAIAQNLSCNLLKDSVYGVAISGVGCVGNITYYVANVYPTPVLSHIDSIKVCANQPVVVPAFVACPAVSTTAWTNNTTSIGLAASGNGNISSFTGLNTTTQVVDALVTVTPSANGCTGPDSTFNIVVSPLPTITVTSFTTCPGTTVPSPTITPSNYTYSWTATNNVNIGMPASGSGVPNPYTAPANNSLVNQTGLITYTPSLNGCVGTPATETITIKPTPFVGAVPNGFYCPSDFVPPIVFHCNPTGGVPIFTYTGLGGIGITQTGNIGSFSATNNTSAQVVNAINVTATLNGCTGPATNFSITVYPNPIANFTYRPVCEGKPVNFIDQSSVGGGISINSWQWDMNNDGVTDISSQNPQYTITPAGVDSVSLQVATNTAPSCSSFVKKAVIINPNPVVDFIGVALKGCKVNTSFTDLSQVHPGSIVSWNWNFGNGQTSSAQFPPSQNYYNSSSSLPAYYSASLIVTTDSGCVGSMVKNNYIEVYPKPIAAFSWSPNTADLLDPTITFVNHAIGAGTYTPTLTYGPYGVEYYLGDNYLTGNSSNIVNNNNTYFNHSYNNPDYADVEEQYPVTQWVINSYGCTDSVTEIIPIQPIVTFYIPNSFSPNGDGINEGFKGTGIGIKDSTYNLWIFDRWGLMIYHADGLEKVWDGHMRGHEGQAILQEDVYVWKVKFNDILGKEHDYHGTVTLLK